MAVDNFTWSQLFENASSEVGIKMLNEITTNIEYEKNLEYLSN